MLCTEISNFILICDYNRAIYIQVNVSKTVVSSLGRTVSTMSLEIGALMGEPLTCGQIFPLNLEKVKRV